MRNLLIILILGILLKILIDKFFLNKIKNLSIIFFYNFFQIVFFISLLYLTLKDIEIFKDFLGIIFASSALLVAVIGFALQNTLKNVLGGFILSYSKSFQLGDRITLRSRDLTGYIENMTLRHTIIRTYTNERVIIPNAILNDEIIINNYLTEKAAAYPLTFDISIDKDIELAKSIIEEKVRARDDIINDEIEVLCVEVTPKEVSLRVFIWTKRIEKNFTVSSKIRLEIVEAFKEKNIY